VANKREHSIKMTSRQTESGTAILRVASVIILSDTNIGTSSWTRERSSSEWTGYGWPAGCKNRLPTESTLQMIAKSNIAWIALMKQASEQDPDAFLDSLAKRI
jgi:hypothetical protein